MDSSSIATRRLKLQGRMKEAESFIEIFLLLIALFGMWLLYVITSLLAAGLALAITLLIAGVFIVGGLTLTGYDWRQFIGVTVLQSASAVLPHPETKEERDALPVGAWYVAPDGSVRIRQ